MRFVHAAHVLAIEPARCNAKRVQGVAGAAAQYQHALYGRTGKDDVAQEALVAAVLDLWRHLRVRHHRTHLAIHTCEVCALRPDI